MEYGYTLLPRTDHPDAVNIDPSDAPAWIEGGRAGAYLALALVVTFTYDMRTFLSLDRLAPNT
jgi:hypothetical protein